MGCGNPKEKLEDELMKTKLERIQVQMERVNQIKLLEEMTGEHIKTAKIPDYIADDTIKNKINSDKKNNSFSNSTSKIKILNKTQRSHSQFSKGNKNKTLKIASSNAKKSKNKKN